MFSIRKNLVFVETDFKISFSNFKYFLNLSNNLISDQDIKFLKSKFFYLDQRDDVIFYAEINKLSYLFKEENVLQHAHENPKTLCNEYNQKRS